MKRKHSFKATAFLAAVTLIVFYGQNGFALEISSKSTEFRVLDVIDGDTLKLDNGAVVRLVQIDSPEMGKECHGSESKNILARLVEDRVVSLSQDPSAGNRDIYNRKLRYVFRGDLNINLELIKRGAAAPWFYDGVRGLYAGRFMNASKRAKLNKVGLWAMCPKAFLNPLNGINSGALQPSLKPADEISSDYITPGSYCSSKRIGDSGISKSGERYICKSLANQKQPRWLKP